ncbi:MAG: hypothetical protein HOE90_21230 [Bacteriovoracaceae bacterium]|jgi:hypothetical protein|nr:hypothetical protein [Bacteriovoracaceae bacterium]
MYFKARWGNALKAISIFCTLVLLSVPIIVYVAQSAQINATTTAVSLLSISALIGCIPFSVRGYRVETNELVILRTFHRDFIPIGEITSIEKIERLPKFTLRVFGNGGLFSFSGNYWSKGIGHFKAYVTNFDNLVMVTAAQKKMLISPDQPDELIAQVQKEMPSNC